MNKLKTLGLVATVFGIGATLFSNWVNDKEMKDEVNRAVEERLKQLPEGELVSEEEGEES